MKINPLDEIAAAQGLERHHVELWAALVALADARKLGVGDEIEQFAAQVGRLLAARLAAGDRDACTWLASADLAARLGDPMPTPSGKAPPSRPLSILWGLNAFNREHGRKPTRHELLGFLNAKRRAEALPPVLKADVSKAIAAMPHLKTRFATATKGRPRNP